MVHTMVYIVAQCINGEPSNYLHSASSSVLRTCACTLTAFGDCQHRLTLFGQAWTVGYCTLRTCISTNHLHNHHTGLHCAREYAYEQSSAAIYLMNIAKKLYSMNGISIIQSHSAVLNTVEVSNPTILHHIGGKVQVRLRFQVSNE